MPSADVLRWLKDLPIFPDLRYHRTCILLWILVRHSFPSSPLWFGSRGHGCALRLWSRGLNVRLCGCCLCPPFSSVLFGITCRTPTSSFRRSNRTCIYDRSKALAEVIHPSLRKFHRLQRLHPYLLVRVKIEVQLILCWPLSRWLWVRILGTFIS
jgi:hypothetical protein